MYVISLRNYALTGRKNKLYEYVMMILTFLSVARIGLVEQEEYVANERDQSTVRLPVLSRLSR